MTRFTATYEDDMGRANESVSLSSLFVVSDVTTNDTGIPTTSTAVTATPPEENLLIPSVFFDAVQLGVKSYCRLSLTPRRVLCYLDSAGTLRYELPIPFMGGTAKYSQFLNEIESNSLILNYSILPERIAPPLLHTLIKYR